MVSPKTRTIEGIDCVLITITGDHESRLVMTAARGMSELWKHGSRGLESDRGRVIVIIRVTWARPRRQQLIPWCLPDLSVIPSNKQVQGTLRPSTCLPTMPPCSRRPAAARLPPVRSRHTSRTSIRLTIPTKRFHWCALLCDLVGRPTERLDNAVDAVE